VVSLAVAHGRLKEFDRDNPADTATAGASVETVPPSTGPAPSPTATPPTTTAAKPGPPAGMFAELFALMNADRGARGLAPLAWDDRLAANAQSVSDTMAESELVAPKDLDAILALGFTRAGEGFITSSKRARPKRFLTSVISISTSSPVITYGTKMTKSCQRATPSPPKAISSIPIRTLSPTESCGLS